MKGNATTCKKLSLKAQSGVFFYLYQRKTQVRYCFWYRDTSLGVKTKSVPTFLAFAIIVTTNSSFCSMLVCGRQVGSLCVWVNLYACLVFQVTCLGAFLLLFIIRVLFLLCMCVYVHTGVWGSAMLQWMQPIRVEGRALVHLYHQHCGRPACLWGGSPKPQDQVSE